LCAPLGWRLDRASALLCHGALQWHREEGKRVLQLSQRQLPFVRSFFALVVFFVSPAEPVRPFAPLLNVPHVRVSNMGRKDRGRLRHAPPHPSSLPPSPPRAPPFLARVLIPVHYNTEEGCSCALKPIGVALASVSVKICFPPVRAPSAGPSGAVSVQPSSVCAAGIGSCEMIWPPFTAVENNVTAVEIQPVLVTLDQPEMLVSCASDALPIRSPAKGGCGGPGARSGACRLSITSAPN